MKFGMIIDLNLCSSCGACALACKAENNTRTRGEGQSFNWADFLQETKGTFPNSTQVAVPVMCNHCEIPQCVKVCPTGAMFRCCSSHRRSMHRLPSLSNCLPVLLCRVRP